MFSKLAISFLIAAAIGHCTERSLRLRLGVEPRSHEQFLSTPIGSEKTQGKTFQSISGIQNPDSTTQVTGHTPLSAAPLLGQISPQLSSSGPLSIRSTTLLGADPIEEILVPFDLKQANWLYQDVSSWEVTARLNVSFSGNRITMDYDKVNNWPLVQFPTEPKKFNANGWIFAKEGGQWHAASWTWLRPEKFWRDKSDVSGTTIKRAPLHNFTPQSGKTYYFMVSGLARMGLSNIQERSNVVKVVWP